MMPFESVTRYMGEGKDIEEAVNTLAAGSLPPGNDGDTIDNRHKRRRLLDVLQDGLIYREDPYERLNSIFD